MHRFHCAMLAHNATVAFATLEDAVVVLLHSKTDVWNPELVSARHV